MNIPDMPLLLESRIVPGRWGVSGLPSVAATSCFMTEDSLEGQTAREEEGNRDREAQCLLSNLEYRCKVSFAACFSPTENVTHKAVAKKCSGSDKKFTKVQCSKCGVNQINSAVQMLLGVLT